VALREVEKLMPAPPEDARQIMKAAARATGEAEALRKTMESVSVNVGLIGAGTSPNLVPASAAASVDIRIPLGLSTSEVETEIQARLGGREGVSWTVTRRYEPSWTASTTPFAIACLEGARRACGPAALLDNRIGGSDARLWRRSGYDSAVVGLTPMNLGAPNEACSIEELSQLYAVYDAIVGELHVNDHGA
jgi:succinyl-diaminopimelate desuccinylase